MDLSVTFINPTGPDLDNLLTALFPSTGWQDREGPDDPRRRSSHFVCGDGIIALLAQRDRAPASEAGRCEFDSPGARQLGSQPAGRPEPF